MKPPRQSRQYFAAHALALMGFHAALLDAVTECNGGRPPGDMASIIALLTVVICSTFSYGYRDFVVARHGIAGDAPLPWYVLLRDGAVVSALLSVVLLAWVWCFRSGSITSLAFYPVVLPVLLMSTLYFSDRTATESRREAEREAEAEKASHLAPRRISVSGLAEVLTVMPSAPVTTTAPAPEEAPVVAVQRRL
jgi:hypothetical protein